MGDQVNVPLQVVGGVTAASEKSVAGCIYRRIIWRPNIFSLEILVINCAGSGRLGLR